MIDDEGTQSLKYRCDTWVLDPKEDPSPALFQEEEKVANFFSFILLWSSSVNLHQVCDPQFEEKLLSAQKQEVYTIKIGLKQALFSQLNFSVKLFGRWLFSV